MVIWGDYNAAKAQQFEIQFVMCEYVEGGKCKTEAEIREWLMRKFILILYNHIIFDQDAFYEETLKKESRILYIPISSQVR